MSTLLVKNADVLITLGNRQQKLPGGAIFVRDNIIEQIGLSDDLPSQADEVIDAAGLAILPGLVNTHHHFFQSLLRAVPGAQDHGLFDWLVRLFPIFSEVNNDAMHVASLTAMAEMILSGCTTSSDHLYMYPNDIRMEAQVQAAREIGIRFHVTRGSQSLGRSKGGLPPDYLVEDDARIIEDCHRVIEAFHDPSPFSMLRVGVAPCTPFSVTRDLMSESANLARSYENVRLHTHVAETMDEVVFCEREFNQRPAQYMAELGWVGPDVWWAHSVFVNSDEIKMMAETGTGVAHCPSSNMRLGSGISPIREMLDAGVNVGIGVDGSASNDTGHVFDEARHAVLLQRVLGGAGNFSVQEGLDLATKGGAAVLGREAEIGSLEVGKAADFIGVNLNTLSMAGGAVHDPLAALLLCRVDKVDLSVINGKIVVQNGTLQTIDLESHIARHNEIAAKIFSNHHEPERFKLV
jgi:cytosine/adenosine deaminase-related metal-dependent hydrolase